MGAVWCSAQGYWSCPNCPWPGVLKDVKGTWHENDFGVLEVSGISQCCQWCVTGHNMHEIILYLETGSGFGKC